MSNFLENLLSTVDENDSELILYSDGCKDYETIQYLQKKADISQWIRLILSPQQQGYSIANNCAVSKSTAEYLVFMNSDVFPENGSVDVQNPVKRSARSGGTARPFQIKRRETPLRKSWVT